MSWFRVEVTPAGLRSETGHAIASWQDLLTEAIKSEEKHSLAQAEKEAALKRYGAPVTQYCAPGESGLAQPLPSLTDEQEILLHLVKAMHKPSPTALVRSGKAYETLWPNERKRKHWKQRILAQVKKVEQARQEFNPG